jgi:hypothetical protein
MLNSPSRAPLQSEDKPRQRTVVFSNNLEGELVSGMSEIVSYTVGGNTQVGFEVDPPPGFRPVGAGQVVGRVEDAVRPAVAAAREVLDQIKALSPDEVEVKFGIKVSGTAAWLVAKAAAEASFEVTMTWRSEDEVQTGPDPS